MTVVDNVQRADFDRVVLCDHARERCAEMGIPTKRVKRGVANPEFDYPQNGPNNAGTRMAQFDELTVPYRISNRLAIVITVLWRSYDPEEVHTR